MTFRDLLDAHQAEILQYLTRLSGHAADAEDLFQDTFLRAFAAFGRLRAGSNHRAWLFRIATNAFLNDRRGRRRRNEVLISSDEPASRGAAREIVMSVEVAAVRRAMGLLPPRQRAALVQRKLQGQEYGDIGRSLGCSSAAARAHVYQALRRLRRLLAEGGSARELQNVRT